MKKNLRRNCFTLRATIVLLLVVPSVLRAQEDILHLENINGGSIGTSISLCHTNEALEGADGFDDPGWPPEPPGQRFFISTAPYGENLWIDARPATSESRFICALSVHDDTGLGVTSTNRLRFAFDGSPCTNRLYSAKIHVDGNWTTNGANFDAIVDIRALIDNADGYIGLPCVVAVPDGTNYGTVEVSCKFLAPPVIQTVTSTNRVISCQTTVQPISFIELEHASNPWFTNAVVTNMGQISVNSTNFNTNTLCLFSITAETNWASRFLRVKTSTTQH